MKKKLLKIVNPLLFLSIFVQLFSNIWLNFFDGGFPAYNTHMYNGYIFSVLALIHLGLNFSWFKQQFKPKHK